MNKKRKLIKKWALLIFCIFIVSILQSTVGLFEIFGKRPVLFLPFSVGCSMFLGQKDAAIFGGISGCFWDCFSGRLFGYSSLILIAVCVFSSLTCLYFVHASAINSIFLTSIWMALYYFIDFVFRYMIWDFENSWSIWTYHIIPTAAYTIFITPFVYFVCGFIIKRLKKEKTAEYSSGL